MPDGVTHAIGEQENNIFSTEYLLPICCTTVLFIINHCFDMFRPQHLAIFR